MRLCALILFCFAAAITAEAQATRTWVSGVGDDVNPCSRTAPCKTFAGAITKTAAGGEINCLDPGGFGSVTISKSITIDCTGTFGSVLTATNGIVINAPGEPLVAVRLRGIEIIAAAAGTKSLAGSGIVILSPARVFIEDTIIDGFWKAGVSAESASHIFISNSRIRNNPGRGVEAAPKAPPPDPKTKRVPDYSAEVIISGSEINGNGTGLRVEEYGVIRVSNSAIVFNIIGVHVGPIDPEAPRPKVPGRIISYKNNVVEGNATNIMERNAEVRTLAPATLQ